MKLPECSPVSLLKGLKLRTWSHTWVRLDAMALRSGPHAFPAIALPVKPCSRYLNVEIGADLNQE